MNKQAAMLRINQWAAQGEPFLFITDFSAEHSLVIPAREINPEEILFDIRGHKNFEGELPAQSMVLAKQPLPYAQYHDAYQQVQHEITQGNTYLLNLTFPTRLQDGLDLKAIFFQSRAKYRLWLKDRAVVFSPETFVQIADGQIASFPMKGTIDADLPHARRLILDSAKEKAEHTTIVDLIRNDMSRHAHDVRVEKFRYIDEIKSHSKRLLQVSSKITGRLPKDYWSRLGNILFSLLPAGSICGAPKQKTLEIIRRVEGCERGLYTGIVGYFDGQSFDSGVMIRYIERQGEACFYKSGGGIHHLSQAKAEYQEMIDKVYVPIC